jgi:hypothetical protein
MEAEPMSGVERKASEPSVADLAALVAMRLDDLMVLVG